MDLAKPTTQKQFGLLVGISQPAVSDLLQRSVIKEGDSAGQWLLAYCGHLREQAAGRSSGIGTLNLVDERARLAREQADKIAYQNAITRGELAPVAILEEVLANTAAKVAKIFDAIPGMVRRRIPTLTADDIDLIADEIAKGRNLVAQISLADVYEDDTATNSHDDIPLDI